MTASSAAPLLATYNIFGRSVSIEPYDVMQVTRYRLEDRSHPGYVRTWLDYSTIRDKADAKAAVRLVRRGEPGTRFRVVRAGQVILG